MKSFALLSASLAAIGAVSASPTKSFQEPPTKRADTPAQVSVSGNGMFASVQLAVTSALLVLTRLQLSGPMESASTFAV